MNLNFDNVEPVSGGYVRPGTIDVFKIESVEFGRSQSGDQNPYMKLNFVNKNGEMFNHRFYMTNKAASRIQTIGEIIKGEYLRGDVNEKQLEALFTGKKVALKITASINTDKGRGYANLPYSGFCAKVENIGNLSFTKQEQEDIEKSRLLEENSNVDNADVEGSMGSDSSDEAGF